MWENTWGKPDGAFKCSQCGNNRNVVYDCGLCGAWVCSTCIEHEATPGGTLNTCKECRKDREQARQCVPAEECCRTCFYPAHETDDNPCTKWECHRNVHLWGTYEHQGKR